jgi:rhodanese-related sulfurtransferase
MFRRSVFRFIEESSLTELKGVALATLRARAAGAPRPSTVIIDVREPSELAADGKIPTAINVPMGRLADALAEGVDPAIEDALGDEVLDPAKHTLILSCRSGRRTLVAYQIAKESGYKASHYAGGNIGYQADPLTDADIDQFLKESSRNEAK